MSEAGSGIEGFRHQSLFASYVAERLSGESFKLVDVGCAGGLARGWRVFGDRLSALGFDTNADEVARLTAAEANRAVRYVAGWVGMPDDHPLKKRIGPKAFWHQWTSGRLAYERTHNIRAALAKGTMPLPIEDYYRQEVLNLDWLTTPVGDFDRDYVRPFEVFPVSEQETSQALDNVGPGVIIHLPPYLRAAGFEDADFVKLDIDGPDYEVLRSITSMLERPSLLGLSLEVCFYGSHDANDNSFHNVDRLMREKGFDLYGLSVRTYAQAALPFPYLDAHPSMNTGGRPVQGDALYMRDLGSRIRSAEAAGLSDEKLAKAAALFALFTLPDSAAEMLVVHRDRLSRVLDVDHGLNLLAAEIETIQTIPTEPFPGGYRQYLADFEAENHRFFDFYSARNLWWDTTTRAAAETSHIKDRLQAAELKLAEAQTALDAELNNRNQDTILERLADLESENLALRQTAAVLEQDRRRLAAIESSSSWLLTAPLRSLIKALRRG